MMPMLAYLLVRTQAGKPQMINAPKLGQPEGSPAIEGPGNRHRATVGWYRRFRLWLGVGGAVTEDVLPVLSTALSRHVAPTPQAAPRSVGSRAVPAPSLAVAGRPADGGRPDPEIAAVPVRRPTTVPVRPVLPAGGTAVIGCRA